MLKISEDTAQAWARVAQDPLVSRLVFVRIDGDDEVLITVALRNLPMPRAARFQGELRSVLAHAEEFIAEFRAGLPR